MIAPVTFKVLQVIETYLFFLNSHLVWLARFLAHLVTPHMKVFISDSADVYEHQIAEVAAYIKKSRRAIVITGAGISCSSGIPVRRLEKSTREKLPRSNNQLSPFLPHLHLGLSVNQWSIQLGQGTTSQRCPERSRAF